MDCTELVAGNYVGVFHGGVRPRVKCGVVTKVCKYMLRVKELPTKSKKDLTFSRKDGRLLYNKDEYHDAVLVDSITQMFDLMSWAEAYNNKKDAIKKMKKDIGNLGENKELLLCRDLIYLMIKLEFGYNNNLSDMLSSY